MGVAFVSVSRDGGDQGGSRVGRRASARTNERLYFGWSIVKVFTFAHLYI